MGALRPPIALWNFNFFSDTAHPFCLNGKGTEQMLCTLNFTPDFCEVRSNGKGVIEGRESLTCGAEFYGAEFYGAESCGAERCDGISAGPP